MHRNCTDSTRLIRSKVFEEGFGEELFSKSTSPIKSISLSRIHLLADRTREGHIAVFVRERGEDVVAHFLLIFLYVT